VVKKGSPAVKTESKAADVPSTSLTTSTPMEHPSSDTTTPATNNSSEKQLEATSTPQRMRCKSRHATPRGREAPDSPTQPKGKVNLPQESNDKIIAPPTTVTIPAIGTCAYSPVSSPSSSITSRASGTASSTTKLIAYSRLPKLTGARPGEARTTDARADQDHMKLHKQLKDKISKVRSTPCQTNTELSFLRKFIERVSLTIPDCATALARMARVPREQSILPEGSSQDFLDHQQTTG
jgi:hypothetical protein